MIARLTRRIFLGLSLAAGFALVTRRVRAQGNPFAALPAFLDTLIPADETPAASALGVDAAIMDEARGRESLMRLVTAGCAWLDDQARRRGAPSFAALGARERVALVEVAEAAPLRSLPLTFFNRLRELAMGYYYARPEAWPGTGFERPPQPEGYMDFAAAPAPKRR